MSTKTWTVAEAKAKLSEVIDRARSDGPETTTRNGRTAVIVVAAANVVSEWAKLRPNPGVVAWLAGTDEARVFISVVTLAELPYGIERTAAGSRLTLVTRNTSDLESSVKTIVNPWR